MKNLIVTVRRLTNGGVAICNEAGRSTRFKLCRHEFAKKFPKLIPKGGNTVELIVSARKSKGAVLLHRRRRMQWGTYFYYGRGLGFYYATDKWLHRTLPENIFKFYVRAK